MSRLETKRPPERGGLAQRMRVALLMRVYASQFVAKSIARRCAILRNLTSIANARVSSFAKIRA